MQKNSKKPLTNEKKSIIIDKYAGEVYACVTIFREKEEKYANI